MLKIKMNPCRKCGSKMMNIRQINWPTHGGGWFWSCCGNVEDNEGKITLCDNRSRERMTGRGATEQWNKENPPGPKAPGLEARLEALESQVKQLLEAAKGNHNV